MLPRMTRRCSLWWSLLATLAVARVAVATESRSLAFVQLAGGAGYDAQRLETLEETLLTALGSNGYFVRVTGRSDLNTLLGFERAKALVGCSDNDCLVELAGALGVQYVGAADVGRIGEVTVLTLKIIEQGSGEVAARAMRQVRDDTALVDALSGVSRDAARMLRERDVRLGRIGLAPLALAFVPFGVGQFANHSPVKGSLLLGGEVAAFATAGVALWRFESSKIPGSGGLFEGGRFRDPAAAASLQSVYLTAVWTGVALAAVGIVEALVNRE